MKMLTKFATTTILFAGLLGASKAFPVDSPKFDKKHSDDKRTEECAKWSSGEVKRVSDSKQKATQFKEHFQKCLMANGLPSHLAFSGKYKP